MRKNYYSIFLISLLLLRSSTVNAFGIGDLVDPLGVASFVSDSFGGIFGGFIDGATSGMIDNIKAAGRELEDHFMDLLRPTIEKINTMARDLESKVNSDVQATVEHVKGAINDTIHEGYKLCIQLMDHSMEDMVKAASQVFDRVDHIEDVFFQGMNKILDKLSQLEKDVDCSIEGISTEWMNEYMTTADDGLIPNPFDHCRKELGLGFTRASSLDNYTKYKLFKCRILEKITEKSPLTDILQYCGDGQDLAARFRCLSRMSPDAVTEYTKEWVQWGVWYDTWSHSRTSTL